MAAAPGRADESIVCSRYLSFSALFSFLLSFLTSSSSEQLFPRLMGDREGFFRPFHSSCRDISYFRLRFSVPNHRHSYFLIYPFPDAHLSV